MNPSPPVGNAQDHILAGDPENPATESTPLTALPQSLLCKRVGCVAVHSFFLLSGVALTTLGAYTYTPYAPNDGPKGYDVLAITELMTGLGLVIVPPALQFIWHPLRNHISS